MRNMEVNLREGEERAVFGADQPQYIPLEVAILTADTKEYPVASEWMPTVKELEQLNAGGRIRVTQLTFHGSLQPIHVEVV